MLTSDACSSSTPLNNEKDLTIIFWVCTAIMTLLLLLNLKEIALTPAWRHDALTYYSSYWDKLTSEGRWINFYLFPFLKVFPPHLGAILSIFFFGGFIFLAALRMTSYKNSILFMLLLLQIHPIYSIIQWPLTGLPANFFLFLCACLSHKWRYEYVFLLGAILFHGTFNNLYNLLPLLFLSDVRSLKQAVRLILVWALFFIIGYAAAQLMTLIITSHFFHAAQWRNPRPVKDIESLFANCIRASKCLSFHLKRFGRGNLILCLIACVYAHFIRKLRIGQILILAAISLSCYLQVIPMGLDVFLRTAYPLYVALLAFFLFTLKPGRRTVAIPLVVLSISSSLFLDNINYLKYYNKVTSTWINYFKDINIEPAFCHKLIFLATNEDCWRIEKAIIQRNQLHNNISEWLGTAMRWVPVAQAQGFNDVVCIWPNEKDIERITPSWITSCEFHTNQLYQWAINDNTLIVRFNPDLLQSLK